MESEFLGLLVHKRCHPTKVRKFFRKVESRDLRTPKANKYEWWHGQQSLSAGRNSNESLEIFLLALWTNLKI